MSLTKLKDWLLLNSESEATDFCIWLGLEVNESDNNNISLQWRGIAPSKPWIFKVNEAIEQIANKALRKDIIKGINKVDERGMLQIIQDGKTRYNKHRH